MTILKRHRQTILHNGYSPKNKPFTHFVVHSTNGAKGSSLEAEVNFLRTNTRKIAGRYVSVSAHYLIGKAGEIIEIVDPTKYTAVHVGLARPGINNTNCVGVELHYTPGEGIMPWKMLYSLTLLKREFSELIPVTHRSIAIPPGRKIDPSCMSDEFFTYWKQNYTKDMKLIMVQGNVRARASIQSPIVTTYRTPQAFVMFGDPLESNLAGGTVNGNNRWIYIGNGYVHQSITTNGSL